MSISFLSISFLVIPFCYNFVDMYSLLDDTFLLLESYKAPAMECKLSGGGNIARDMRH